METATAERDSLVNLQELEQEFQWRDPVAGDKWNADYHMDTVAIGCVKNQVLVRIYKRNKTPAFPEEYKAALIFSESDGGASRCHLVEGGRVDDVKERVADALFGRLRNFIVCSSCGEIHHTDGWVKEVSERLARLQLCFSCDFWTDLEKKKNDPLVAIVEQQFYEIDVRENMPDSCKGFAGQKFTIQWFDGRPSRTTTNLWTCGSIPAMFKDRIPNNASFQK